MTDDNVVRLRAPIGTDEANVGETRFKVHDDCCIEVPRDVAVELENSPSGFVEADPKPLPEPEGTIQVRGQPGASCSWRGKTYSVDPSGLVTIPAAAVAELRSHGLRPV